MDITLERVLSLIPKKEDGNYVHGAKKEFAESIGLSSGNLVADWINNRSTSYHRYLYEISAKYNVSVAWLKGETDDPTPEADELTEARIDHMIENMSREELTRLIVRASEMLRDK